MADSGNVRTGRDLRDHLVNFLYFTDKKLITITAVIIGVNSFKHLNILSTLQILVVFPGGSDGKESACYAGDLGSILGLGRFPVEVLQPPPIFLPGEFHGQRSVVGYSSWGCKKLDMTERPAFTHSSWPHTPQLQDLIEGFTTYIGKSVFQHKKEVFSRRIPGKEKSPRQTPTTPRGVLTRRGEGLAT